MLSLTQIEAALLTSLSPLLFSPLINLITTWRIREQLLFRALQAVRSRVPYGAGPCAGSGRLLRAALSAVPRAADGVAARRGPEHRHGAAPLRCAGQPARVQGDRKRRALFRFRFRLRRAERQRSGGDDAGRERQRERVRAQHADAARQGREGVPLPQVPQDHGRPHHVHVLQAELLPLAQGAAATRVRSWRRWHWRRCSSRDGARAKADSSGECECDGSGEEGGDEGGGAGYQGEVLGDTEQHGSLVELRAARSSRQQAESSTSTSRADSECSEGEGEGREQEAGIESGAWTGIAIAFRPVRQDGQVGTPAAVRARMMGETASKKQRTRPSAPRIVVASVAAADPASPLFFPPLRLSRAALPTSLAYLPPSLRTNNKNNPGDGDGVFAGGRARSKSRRCARCRSAIAAGC